MSVKEKMSNFSKELINEASENKSTILTILAVAGVAGTLVTSTIAALKTKEKIDAANGAINKDNIGDIVKYYIPVALSTGVTITCVICAHKADMAKYAALAAVYASDSKKLESLSKEISDRITDKTVKSERDIPVNNDSVDEKFQFYDTFTGTYIWTSYRKLLEACNCINELLHDEINVHCKDFYDILSHETGESINDADYYWNHNDGALSLEFGAMLNDNFEMYRTVKFSRNPGIIEQKYFY